jgi:Mn2+/Fe2+ NRAMP family transporter
VSAPRSALTDRRDRRGWRTRVLALLAILGPGLIAANAGNDAGGILTYASAGVAAVGLLSFVVLVETLFGLG